MFKRTYIESAYGEGHVPSVCILRSFKKVAPEIDPELIRIRLKEKGVPDLITGINQDYFVAIFSATDAQERPNKLHSDPLYWIQKLDDVMFDWG